MDERRSSPRRRTLLGAQLRAESGAVLGDCVVRDLSQTGARLHMAKPVAVPSRVEIEIARTGERHSAQVMWVRESEVGVRFEAGHAAPSPAAPDRTVQEILDEARLAIAALLGVRPGTLVVKLDVAEPSD